MRPRITQRFHFMPISFSECSAETVSNLMVSFIESMKHAAGEGRDIYNLFNGLVHKHRRRPTMKNPEVRSTVMKRLCLPLPSDLTDSTS